MRIFRHLFLGQSLSCFKRNYLYATFSVVLVLFGFIPNLSAKGNTCLPSNLITNRSLDNPTSELIFGEEAFYTDYIKSQIKADTKSIEETQIDASNYFIHEVIDGKYGLIKNVQQGLEIILRSDRIELLQKADPAKGIYEVSTYLLFGGSNNVDPKGKEFIDSKKIGVKDNYSEESVRFLKADFIQVHKYKSVVYSDFYDNVDLQVSIDNQGNINFNLLAKDNQTTIPFDIKVWDSKVKSVSDGIMTNGVKITSKKSKISLKEGKIIFESGNQERESLSFTLNTSTQSF